VMHETLFAVTVDSKIQGHTRHGTNGSDSQASIEISNASRSLIELATSAQHAQASTRSAHGDLLHGFDSIQRVQDRLGACRRQGTSQPILATI
jgi:hypothetical protein